MVIKIPKQPIFLLLLIVLVGGSLWLGMRSGRQETPPSSSPTPAVPPTPRENVREIEVTAKQFEFSPDPIRVKLGETVRLSIISTDVTHGFSLPEFGINETLEPGKTVRVEFKATKKGEFPFSCSVFCGAGHSEMRGVLIVE